MTEYIDKEEFRKIIHEHHYFVLDTYNTRDWGMFTVGIDRAIDDVPAADVRENVRGHDTGEERYFKCSECGYGVSDVYEAGPVLVFEHGKEWHYCPNCGAKMEAAP